MAEAKPKTPAELELIENADGTVSVVDPDEKPAATTAADDQDEDNDSPTKTEESTQAADDAAAAAGDTEDEREAIRARRRQERADKKAAQREREDHLRSELALRDAQLREMQENLALVNRRLNGTDMAQLDTAAKRAGDAAEYYKNIIAEATKKQDGAAVAEATEAMIRARQEADRLTGIKTQMTQQASRPQPQALDPRLKSQADAFLSRHTWYKPQDNTADAQVLRAVDNAVMAEGFDPTTRTYWDELDKRLKKYLPHRAARSGSASGDDSGYTDDTAARGKQGTPVAGSGRDGRSAGGAGAPRGGSQFQLSAARVQALKDAGMWDDPKARADMIRRYREQDRTDAAQRSGS